MSGNASAAPNSLPQPPPPPPVPSSLLTKPAKVTTSSTTLVIDENIQKTLKAVPPGEKEVSRHAIETATKFAKQGNDGCEWLTYESFFNHPQFHHSNKSRPMGAFTMPLKHARVVLCDGLDEEKLKELQQSFFPSLSDTKSLKDICYKPWDKTHVKKTVDKTVTMPYNAVQNSIEARAIGTTAHPELHCLAGEWDMWQTASRSCVVRLSSTESWKPLPLSTYQSSSSFGWDFGDTKDGTAKDPLSVAAMKNCYSVKTGVVKVGEVDQSSEKQSGKGTLEPESLIAALRSNYITALHNLPKHNTQLAKDRLIILPEVLTVTYGYDAPLTEVNGLLPVKGDGFQVRDLSALLSTNEDLTYVPPLSIPYIGQGPLGTELYSPDFKTHAGKYGGLSEPREAAIKWATYWTHNFARRLGEAKAIALLCYGFQGLTPNAQNFLLQYDRKSMTPTKSAKVVIRDLLDMRLHTHWVSTIFGDHAAVTPGAKLTLKDHRFDQRAPDVLKYEGSDPSLTPLETTEVKLADNTVQYFSGTQLNWFPYTSLFRGSMVAQTGKEASDRDPRAQGWQRALHINTLWGLAHALEYVRVINEQLKLDPPITYQDIFDIPLEFDDPKLAGRCAQFKFLAKTSSSTDKNEEVTVGNQPNLNLKDKAIFDFVANANIVRDLPDNADGWKRAGELYELFCQWERQVSRMIHERLFNEEGKRKLREYHGLPA